MSVDREDEEQKAIIGTLGIEFESENIKYTILV